MTAPIAPAVPATVKVASRAKLERALKRLYTAHGKTFNQATGMDGNIPADAKTDISGLTTHGALFEAYLGTFPAGAVLATYVGLTDRLWYGKIVKTKTVLTDPAQIARFNRVKPTLEAEEKERAEKRAVREANGPSTNALKRRDEIAAAMKAVKLPDAKIEEALKAAGLPSLHATVKAEAKSA